MPRFSLERINQNGMNGRTIILADYYKHDEGWVVFKTDGHKPVYELPERNVAGISRMPDLDSTDYHLVDFLTDAVHCTSECTGRGEHYSVDFGPDLIIRRHT
jgi:hypothetical protein